MRKLLAATVLTIATLAVAAPAGAGGWAVTTLDPLAAAPVAGEPFEVGFTIRQHGRTPVSMPDAAIIVTDATGADTRFAAVPQGAVGHHVATVEVPADGSYRWAVDQVLGVQELGTLQVGGSRGRHDRRRLLALDRAAVRRRRRARRARPPRPRSGHDRPAPAPAAGVIGRPFVLLAAGALAAGAGLLTLRPGRRRGGARERARRRRAVPEQGLRDVPRRPRLGGAGATSGRRSTTSPSFAASRLDGTSAADYVRLSIVAPQSFISPARPEPRGPDADLARGARGARRPRRLPARPRRPLSDPPRQISGTTSSMKRAICSSAFLYGSPSRCGKIVRCCRPRRSR